MSFCTERVVLDVVKHDLVHGIVHTNNKNDFLFIFSYQIQ